MYKNPDGTIDKAAIINSMCLSHDHRYFLASLEEAQERFGDDPVAVVTCMSQKEKDYLHKQMTHLYEGDIEPFMKIKKKYRK